MYHILTNYPSSVKSHFDELIDEHAYRYLDVCPEIKAFDRFDESAKSGSDLHYIGMVWSEGDSKLDLKEVPLRGSQSLTDNAKVTLDLSEVSQEFSFFPGQIIAFSARPSYERNRHLIVKRLIDPMKIMPPFPDKEFTPSQPRSVIVASGPFATHNDNGDINTTTLANFLDQCKRISPSHIILIGPFLDSDNKERMLKSPKEVQDELNSFVNQIQLALSELTCTVYLLSSPKTLMSESINSVNIYPCPKLSFKISSKVGKKKSNLQIISTHDPSHLDLDDILVSVTSVDVLFHLSSSEVTINRTTEDRMALISRHLLSQANLYPIFPAKQEVSVDYSALKKFYKFQRSPQILITPSRLGCFVKKVDGCLIINPQRPASGSLKQFIRIDLEPDKNYNGSLVDGLHGTTVKLTEAKPVVVPLITHKSDEMETETEAMTSSNGIGVDSV